jgi:PAS domain S-box-containing protein
MTDHHTKKLDSPQIMVVDDSPASLKLLADILTHQGYQVRPAADGRLALRSVAVEAPDVILLDVKMPEMDGYEVCRLLKSDEKTRGIPVIFVSALEDVADKVKGFEAGGVDYIIKPFEPAEVLVRVETHLRLRRLQEHMEELVTRRSTELSQANADLKAEIVERKRVEDELRKSNRTLTVFSECNQAVVRAKDEASLLHDVCHIIVKIGSYAMAWVGFAEQNEEKTVRPAAHAGLEEGYLTAVKITWDDTEYGCGPTGTAIRTGKPTVCEDLSTDPAFTPWRAEAVKRNYRSTIAIPLTTNGHALGALSIYAREQRTFDPDEVSLLAELARDLAYGITALRAQDERKQTAEALREKEARMQSIIRAAPTGIAVVSNRILVEVNHRLCEMLGYSANELIGNSTRLLYPTDEDFDQVARVIYADIDEKGMASIETHFQRKDGSIIDVLLNSSIVDFSGTYPELNLTALDLTERKKLEAQIRHAQKMEAIGTLAGGIAHDFNNILGAIMGYTEMAIANSAVDSKLRLYLERVYQAGERARDLVTQILTFSRQTEQERKPVQIAAIAKEVLKLLRSSLPTTIEIQPDITTLPQRCLVLADPTQIHQVLMNLCTNAAHAMRAKGGILSVSMSEIEADAALLLQHPDLGPRSYVRLTVSDTGHGMDGVVMERIFEPYFTTKAPGEGTGLGLAVVQGIVRSHRGTITVDSKPGKGSIFHVLLPIFKQEIPPEAGEEETTPAGDERILFVDDEETLVELGREMLGSLGYRVTAITNSFEALETFRNEPEAFDLVITDMTMPKMTGAQLAKELLKIRPDIPIILGTGFSELIDEKMAKEVGIRELIMKPYAITNIAKTIRQVLEEKRYE